MKLSGANSARESMDCNVDPFQSLHNRRCAYCATGMVPTVVRLEAASEFPR